MAIAIGRIATGGTMAGATAKHPMPSVPPKFILSFGSLTLCRSSKAVVIVSQVTEFPGVCHP